MTNIPITTRNDNLEIVSKLLNSVAVKYDCGVKYNSDAGTLRFSGDENFKNRIVQETVNMFESDY